MNHVNACLTYFMHHFGFNLHWPPFLLVSICTDHLSFWFVQIDLIFNLNLWVCLNFIWEFPSPLFLLGGSKHVLGYISLQNWELTSFYPWYHLNNLMINQIWLEENNHCICERWKFKFKCNDCYIEICCELWNFKLWNNIIKGPILCILFKNLLHMPS
jgi:hypothetical protein